MMARAATAPMNACRLIAPLQVRQEGDEDMAELMDMLSDDGDEDMLTGVGPSTSGMGGSLSAAAAAAPRQPLMRPCVTTAQHHEEQGAGGCGVDRYPVERLPLQGHSHMASPPPGLAQPQHHYDAANGVESRGAGPTAAVHQGSRADVMGQGSGSGAHHQPQTRPPSPRPAALMASREGGIGVSHVQPHDDDESDYGGGSSEDEGAPGWEL